MHFNLQQLNVLADKDKSKEKPVGITCDELKQTVHAYLSHNHKSWKRCASLSQPTVEIKSTRQVCCQG